MPKTLKDAILAQIVPDEVISLAKDLVNIPSYTTDETEVAKFVHGYFQRQGLESELQEVDPGRFQTIGRLRGSGSRGLAAMRALIELAIARGEIKQPELARFPQIVVAPAIIAVIWKSLFERHSPLDATEMLRVHLDLIFGERRTT